MLVDGKGSYLKLSDLTKYATVRSFLLNATATNMANMLSAQLAAMTLNVAAGFVDPAALVYAPALEFADVHGFVSVGALLAAADQALVDRKSTRLNSSHRT